jgi:hypothetical protein
MLTTEYHQYAAERDALIHLCGEENRKIIERIMKITRIMDRAAAEYAEHKDDAEYEGRNEQA